MEMTEVSFVVNRNFSTRFVKDFVFFLQNFKSHIYITTLDKCIPANSNVGLLSVNIKIGDTIRVSAHNRDKSQSESDLNTVIDFLIKMLVAYPETLAVGVSEKVMNNV